jgi:sulfide dehydrogenase cytochrome subunit
LSSLLNERCLKRLVPFQAFFLAAIFHAPCIAANVDEPQLSRSHVQILAASCASCHGTNGNSVGGSAVLAGMDRAHFEKRMLAFRTGERASTVMHHHAKGLTLQEIGLLADYFARQAVIPAALPPSLETH